MVFLVDHDGAMSDAIAATLAPSRQLTRRPAPVDTGALFAELLARRCSDVILVEPLHRLGTTPGSAPGAPLAPLVRAISAAAARLILVTSRPAGDAGLLELRRSGVPYVIVRVPALVELASGLRTAAEREIELLATPDLLERCAPAIPPGAVCDLVRQALDDEQCAGRTIDLSAQTPERHPLIEELERNGRKVAVVPAWRARLWRFLGRSCLTLDRTGVLRARQRNRADQGDEPTAAAQPAS
jgi:hypothetical protein